MPDRHSSMRRVYLGLGISVVRSAYIHIPFCHHRCGYCNFSLVAGRDYLIDRFLAALQLEIEQLPESVELDTLFLGGGTPSFLAPQKLQQLQQILASRFTFGADAEITAECNPNDVDQVKLDALLQMGVNRISLGVQSLNPAKLIRLERDHAASDVVAAVELARQSGINSVSLDLIFAAPDETLTEWKTDLEAAMAIAPDHLSTYELTYEKGTQFWNRWRRKRLTIADEDLRADMYEHAIDQLERAGWRQYEVSSFAKPGHRCLHNLRYWDGSDYLAFGPGASRLVAGQRSTNHSSPLTYIKKIESGQDPTSDQEKLTGLAAARERLAIGLRMRAGVNIVQFESATQLPFSVVLPADVAQPLVVDRLLEIRDGTCRLTKPGMMVSDSVAGKIVNLDDRFSATEDC